MSKEIDKAVVIPQKILEEVALRKKFAEEGIQVVVFRKRQWGGTLANALLNHTEDAEIIEQNNSHNPLSHVIRHEIPS